MQQTAERHQMLWLLAASPAIWSAHFMICYITAAVWCGRIVGPDGPFLTARRTIAAYTAQQRTERAARLLATTTQSVQDIALFVGYDDANYFVKVFRAAHGMTPSAYRDLQAE